MPPIRPLPGTKLGERRSSTQRRTELKRNERFITWTIAAAVALAAIVAGLGEAVVLWRQYGGQGVLGPH